MVVARVVALVATYSLLACSAQVEPPACVDGETRCTPGDAPHVEACQNGAWYDAGVTPSCEVRP